MTNDTKCRLCAQAPYFQSGENSGNEFHFLCPPDPKDATTTLSTDQFGTQLDPLAHWNPYYPAIDELPPTYTIRPLVVIPIQDKAAKDPGYQMNVNDIRAWEQRNGRIPEGSVVFIRSDWSKEWPNPGLATRTQFPGVKIDALKLLHLERKILFHGHEALDTDTTPTLEGEAWLLRNALVAIGFPKTARWHRWIRTLHRDLSGDCSW